MRRQAFFTKRSLTRRTTALAAAVAVVAGVGTVSAAHADPSPTPVTTDGVWGMDFSGGVLNTVEGSQDGWSNLVARRITPDGSTVSDEAAWSYMGPLANGAHYKRVPCDAGSCVALFGAGNGGVGTVFVGGDGEETVHVHSSPNSLFSTDNPVAGARIVDVTGRYFVYDVPSTGKQYVDDRGRDHAGDQPVVRPITAASVWGTLLWTPGPATGSVSATDLVTRKVVGTVSTGAPCTVGELRAVGRWVYWNCGPDGPAGVYDRTAKKSVTVPSGPALVGDGYLVRHDRAAGKLLLTDFHSGTAAEPRAIADLPAGKTADQRRLTWAVDRFGGDIAYLDADGSVHIVPSGVPPQPLAKLDSDVETDGPMTVSEVAWRSAWNFNKVVDWTFTVKDEGGRAVRTVSGSGTRPDIRWDGTDDAGRPVLNGPHTWTLKATAAEGSGTYSASGAMTVSGGRQGHHDLGGYSYGELVTLNSSGALTLHYTEGGGTFDWKKSASGWPAGSVAVPFGDMGSDRCNELLVRMPDGELRRYAGKCGGVYEPSGSHTSLGTGWKAYDVLTAPGDLTGDGRTDLLARQASTGDAYLFANTGRGGLAAGKRVGSGWSGYTHVVGAGDLNGDGFGDVLARARSGALYRYDGAGDGTLKKKVTLSADWGSTYDTIVGVGDITGDGRNDLVARDTSGSLYRNDGKGNGTFGGRTRIATGWQGYKGIF